MTEYEFRLEISAQEYQRVYAGTAKSVVAEDMRGLRVQFPAAVLRPFVTHAGISGRFVIRMDENHKFVDIRRIT